MALFSTQLQREQLFAPKVDGQLKNSQFALKATACSKWAAPDKNGTAGDLFLTSFECDKQEPQRFSRLPSH
jgi:hypothetical protein